MARKKVGDLIKEARTNAGLSQEKLAAGIEGVSASDISKAERNEKDLTQAQLKAIAKATGVTQKSLLEAASGTGSSAKTKAGSSSDTKKTTSSSTKKTESAAARKATNTSAKKAGTSASKKTTSSGTSMKVTATEKKLVELYRAADSDAKKAAIALLKGEKEETGGILDAILDNSSIMDAISGFFTKE